LCLCIYLFSVFRIVNETLLRPAWRQLLISCTVQTAGQVSYKCTVYRGWNKQPYTCSKQSVLSGAQNEHEGPGLLLDLSCLVFFIGNLIFLLLMSPCRISEPYDNPSGILSRRGAQIYWMRSAVIFHEEHGYMA
jgi:hypothetical protein